MEWQDAKDENGGRPCWLWHAWHDGTTEDEYVDITIGWGQTSKGKWHVQIWMGGDYRRSDPMSPGEAESRASRLVDSMEQLWKGSRR